MANKHADPLKARLARRARQKPGNLADLQQLVWWALRQAEDVLEHAEAPEVRLRAIHALSQCAGQYAKLLEVGELEARLSALEALAKRKIA